MTISTETARMTYSGNGTTTVFPYTYKIFAATDLVVTSTVSGVTTTLTYPTQYSVSGVGVDAGGNVTTTVAPVTGATIVIKRDVLLTQETNYRGTGGIVPATLETSLDRLTMADQWLQDQITNSVAQTGATGAAGPPGSGGVVVASTASRNALYPAPANDFQVFNKETLSQERYQTASATWTTDFEPPPGFVSVREYATLNTTVDAVVDWAAAVQATVDYVETIAYRQRPAVWFPPGQYSLGRTILVRSSGTKLVGADGSELVPHLSLMRAGTMVLAYPASAPWVFPTATKLLAGSTGTAMVFAAPQRYYISLSDTVYAHADVLNTLSAFTADVIFRTDAIPTTGALLQSMGGLYGASSLHTLFTLKVTSGVITASLFTTGGSASLTGTTVLANNTIYHAAVTYDGTTLRLYVGLPVAGTGTMEASGALTGSLLAKHWDQCTLGHSMASFPDASVSENPITMTVEYARLSRIARWTAAGAYVPPAAKPAPDTNNLAYVNFESAYGAVSVGRFAETSGPFPSGLPAHYWVRKVGAIGDGASIACEIKNIRTTCSGTDVGGLVLCTAAGSKVIDHQHENGRFGQLWFHDSFGSQNIRPIIGYAALFGIAMGNQCGWFYVDNPRIHGSRFPLIGGIGGGLWNHPTVSGESDTIIGGVFAGDQYTSQTLIGVDFGFENSSVQLVAAMVLGTNNVMVAGGVIDIYGETDPAPPATPLVLVIGGVNHTFMNMKLGMSRGRTTNIFKFETDLFLEHPIHLYNCDRFGYEADKEIPAWSNSPRNIVVHSHGYATRGEFDRGDLGLAITGTLATTTLLSSGDSGVTVSASATTLTGNTAMGDRLVLIGRQYETWFPRTAAGNALASMPLKLTIELAGLRSRFNSFHTSGVQTAGAASIVIKGQYGDLRGDALINERFIISGNVYTATAGAVVVGTTITVPITPVVVAGGHAADLPVTGNIPIGTTMGYEITFDALQGPRHRGRLVRNVTGLKVAGLLEGMFPRLKVRLTQDGTGGRTVAWDASIIWDGGAAPVQAAAALGATEYEFWLEGTTIRGRAG